MMLPDHVSDPKSLQSPALPCRYYCPECPLVSGLFTEFTHLEEMMAECGIVVDHSTLHRWVIRLVPLLDKAFRRRKRTVGRRWRMDETYIKVKGQWTMEISVPGSRRLCRIKALFGNMLFT